ncbi:MAG: TRAM domain-containing protein [Clostridiales bacterium]|jgi:tRNA-2-methylthio-N6-dimethylallyladenosine synthase|nr:TRAM domain-containing protein [Clostridiales bacterium]
MDCQVPDDIIKARFNKLLETVNPIIYDINKSFIGKTVKALAEDISQTGQGMVSGRTGQNTLVHFESDKSVIGRIIDVEITGVKTFYMSGKIV